MRKNIFQIIFLVIAVAIFFIFSSVSVHAGEKIVFASVVPDNSYLARWYRLVYGEAFKRLDMEMEFIKYPMNRAPYLVTTGRADALPARVHDFNAGNPNLLRVDEPLFDLVFSAYTTDRNLRLDGLDDLMDKSLLVSYRLGVKKCEQMLSAVVNPDKLETVVEDANGLNMLLKGRVDIYVGIETLVEPLLKTDAFLGAPIYKAGVLAKVPNHTFLNKKHKELVPKLESVFKAMKKEGLFAKYSAQAAE